jgi:hypothetical protein
MPSGNTVSPAFHFRVQHGSGEVDCLVTDDACEALGVSKSPPSEMHRRFLEGIAIERLEWCRVPQRTIVIDAWDIATHRED